jgi:hypothetical protein
MGSSQANSGTALSSDNSAVTALQALNTAISSGDIQTAKKALGTFGKDVALASSDNPQAAAPLTSSSRVVQDIRSLQVVLSSGDPKKISTTFIKMRQELTSFAQSPLVFPTSDAGIAKLSVNSSTQAVLQGISATMPGGLPNESAGTSFAPTPELLLGSKGMTIPQGADINFSGTPILLKGLSLAN